MTAREMFEKLGYEQITLNDEQIIYASKNSPTIYITFDKIYRSYIVEYNHLSEFVTPIEHKAITKQMEELGWI